MAALAIIPKSRNEQTGKSVAEAGSTAVSAGSAATYATTGCATTATWTFGIGFIVLADSAIEMPGDTYLGEDQVI